VCILRPNKMNPTCEIVLNAKSLLILDCVNPTTVPITRDKRELNKRVVVQVNSTSNIDLLV
jgi:hypothetical protein